MNTSKFLRKVKRKSPELYEFIRGSRINSKVVEMYVVDELERRGIDISNDTLYTLIESFHIKQLYVLYEIETNLDYLLFKFVL